MQKKKVIILTKTKESERFIECSQHLKRLFLCPSMRMCAYPRVRARVWCKSNEEETVSAKTTESPFLLLPAASSPDNL